MVRGQTERFANFNKKKRKVKSFPGCRVNKVTEEVEKLEIQSRNSCVIAHVGSNDLYLRGGRVGNSEPIVKDMKRLVNKVSEKTNKGIVVGMLPRSYVSHFALSKAIAINERMKKYCDQKKVEFIDLWGMFVGKRHLFRKDGIHLSEAGQRKFGEILNKECEKVMRSDRIGTRESSEVSLVSFFLRQLITESGAVSSSVPPRAHDIRGIATSLNYYSNLSLSAIKEAATWKSNRVFAMRYLKDMSATRSRLKDSGPLIAAGSAVHQN